ncbi:MAG: aspartate carbamoyltransferase catalytic subunit [Deltaproteobacteria bacterium]|jgi:aspartate carbamoyltransferase catalytic subunit|nr:aspartate carbamoyltransferase catalytic subunit [Deltaproteobacteria bacterium]
MSSEYLFAHKHILSLEQLSVPDIEYILNTAESFKEISARAIKKVPVLRGKTVVTLFFEPSTRTRLSFDIAAKRMSADTFSITASTSSTTKGETLADTARNIEAMKPDILIMRHPSSGAPHYLSRHIKTSVINAGDGTHEHPSQGLLDLMTVKDHKGKISGLKVAIIGDISHSRVAHSDIIGFAKMGAKVFVSGPATLIPKEIEQLGATVCSTIKDAVKDADVVMPLRIQKERQNDPLIPSFREYATFFGINNQVLQTAKQDALLMHPGPINRGVELAPDVADSSQSVILDQVTNGVAIRMALMYLVLGGK